MATTDANVIMTNNMKIRKYRFFYHFNKINRKMTVHFKKQCHIVKDVVCNVPCETKWNASQPRLVMRGFAKEVTIKDHIAFIK